MSPVRRGPVPVIALALAALLALSGCKSAEEKAQDYYESALGYMAQDDVERALIELRNVFKYDGFHKDARRLYADTVLEQGKVAEAYGQYLRLIEQYPDTLEVRLILARLAIRAGNWDEVARHGAAAADLAPEDPAAQAIAAALDYRKAVLSGDDAARAAAAARAEALLLADPGSEVARQIAVDARVNGPDPQSALPLIDEAIAGDPDATTYRMIRFRLLVAAGRTEDAGRELEAAYAAAPEDPRLREAMIAWYYEQGDLDGAEAMLRQLAGPDDGAPEGHVTLVRFLAQARGRDAAIAELDRLIAATGGTEPQRLYRGLRAGLQFEAGERDAAVAALREALTDAPASDQTRTLKLTLAQMLATSGDQVGARELVEAVLAEDPNQVAALKMRAAWLIAADDPDGAIVDLRTALNGAPRDVAVLLLMAEAHERAGARELAGERLALAVEVSDSAPEVALRYAGFLLQDGKVQPAETVLTLARQRNPGDIRLVRALADLWLQQQAWPQLQALMAELSAIDDDRARSLASELQAAILLGQNRTEEGLAALEGQFESTGSDRALVLLVTSRLRQGEVNAARQLVEAELAKRPDEPALRLLAATVEVAANDAPRAEEMLRALVADLPQAEQPVRMLATLLISGGRRDEAAALLDAALAQQPDSAVLGLLRAGLHEQAGEFEAAIGIYDALYTRDSSNVIVANNLASLLADRRSDADSLERAAGIARRLRALDQPAFQDTYGWILYRQGKPAEALAPLEAAAAGLPNVPLVQVHLGLAYVALGRDDDAAPYLQRGLEGAAGEAGTPFAEARAALDRIAGGAAGAVAPAEN